MSRRGKQALKYFGHTTVEYAICLTLLGVLALGSLKLLGGSVSQLLGTSTSTQTKTQTNQLFALIGANTNGSSSSSSANATNTASNNSRMASTARSMQLQIDPNTGQAMISDTTGGSKNTTSVDGSTALSMMSKQLGMLASVKMASGEPLPTPLKAQIRRLMIDGISLSNAYNNSTGVLDKFRAVNTANAVNDKTISKYPQPVLDNLGSNLNEALQFQNDYDSLTTLLSSIVKTDPSLQTKLIDPISQLAGSISSIPYNAYGKSLATDFKVNAVKTSGLLKIYQDNPLIGESIPPSVILQSALMPPVKRCPFMQKHLVAIVQDTVVGTPPTAHSVININMDMLTNTTASSTMSGTIPTANKTSPAMSLSASINITPTGISATAFSNATAAKNTP